MIKVIKLKVILKTILILCLIIITCIFIKNILPLDKSITTSSSKKQDEYKIFVDVEESKLYLFENNELIKTYKCSGGKWSTPSPIGTWKIISKAKWGEGFGRKLDGSKCTLGTIWNTWNFRYVFNWMG